jgi:hypothetical protein
VTEPDATAAPEAAEPEPVEEVWTYGGQILDGDKGTVSAMWWPPGAKAPRLFAPEKGRDRYLPGYQYRVGVTREPYEKDGKQLVRTWMHGTRHPVAGPHPDPARRAAIEAQAHAGRQHVEQAALSRRLARQPSALDEACEPLVKLAASMTYDQRAALITVLSRKIYRASLPGRKGTPR